MNTSNELIYYTLLGIISQEAPEKQEKIKTYQATIDQLIADNPDDADIIRVAIMLYTLKQIIETEKED